MIDKSLNSYFSIPENQVPEVVDLCGLEAPEPMEKILFACTQLGVDDCYLARLPHTPNPLFPQLEARGLIWELREEADGSALILIRRKA